MGDLQDSRARAVRANAPFGRGPLAARILAGVIDAAAWGGSRLPARLTHSLAVLGGHIEWMVRPAKRSRLAENLGRAVGASPRSPTVRRLVRREVVNEARRSADLLWALGKPEEFMAAVDVEGAEHAVSAAEQGRGVIVVGAHIGGWEVATAVPREVIPVPTTVIVANDWLAWAIEHARVAAGLRIMYRDEPTLRATRLLTGGEALLLLGDDGWGRDPRTHEVELVGQRAALPAGVATLSRLCQSPIVGFTVLPLGRRRWRVTIDPPLEPPARRGGAEAERAVLQKLVDRWSEVIAANPEHWAASYRIRWTDTR